MYIKKKCLGEIEGKQLGYSRQHGKGAGGEGCGESCFKYRKEKNGGRGIMKHKQTTRMTAILLALLLLLSLAACQGSADTPPADSQTPDPGVETTSPSEAAFVVSDDDEEIYMNNLGDFYEAYQVAVAEENISKHYALLAVAEAKLLESAALTPMYASMAGYTMTRLVYNSSGYASWRGSMIDQSQYVITNEIIKAEDDAHLRQLWKDLQGTGTYLDTAIEYLTEQGYTFNDTYNQTFTDLPTTWNIHQGSTANDAFFARPTFDYLFAYNPEGELVGHLAESYEVSEDGLTYTIHIREGLSWVDSQSRKVADLTADDWVASAQHRADVQNYQTLGLYIKGMLEYATGETTDFSTVGVKAVDKYTLEYTLLQPAPWFMSMMESNDFVPLCRSYFLSQGGAFGIAEFAEASASSGYLYGTDQNHIAYCGAFICTNVTEKNSVTYVLNDSYWNRDNMHLKSVKMTYDSGTDIAQNYTNFKNGTVISLYLSTAHMETAKQNGDYEKYAVLGDVGKTTAPFYFNLHRQVYANVIDGAVPSQKTEEQKEVAEAALQNVHFRRAIAHAIDRGAYLAQSVGEDLKYINIRSTLTPGTYAALEEETTIEINGVATTFPAGTYYGEIVQAQLDADEYPLQAWDAENETTDGWDAWYNPEYAKQELAIAIEELATLGYEVTEENPIVLDYPTSTYNEVAQNQSYVLKAGIEATLEGLVQIDRTEINNSTEFNNVFLTASSGAEVNEDFGANGLIGSSHSDPQCYLEIVLPYGDGVHTFRMGLW